jgi:ribosome-binding protein aMBF1 (putative translation factor)
MRICEICGKELIEDAYVLVEEMLVCDDEECVEEASHLSWDHGDK